MGNCSVYSLQIILKQSFADLSPFWFGVYKCMENKHRRFQYSLNFPPDDILCFCFFCSFCLVFLVLMLLPWNLWNLCWPDLNSECLKALILFFFLIFTSTFWNRSTHPAARSKCGGLNENSLHWFICSNAWFPVSWTGWEEIGGMATGEGMSLGVGLRSQYPHQA